MGGLSEFLWQDAKKWDCPLWPRDGGRCAERERHPNTRHPNVQGTCWLKQAVFRLTRREIMF